jgi:flavin reductase (DIM6/NTAB) family NADH-FMN oxidoreductase RutF
MEKRAMEKLKIDNNAFVYPMPVVLAGSVVDGKANFMAVGWVSRVNFKPPMIGIALSPHYTNKGIDDNQAFSINIPDVSLMEKTDYCGLVSGKKVDKSKIFKVFYGQLPHAPMIEECPLCILISKKLIHSHSPCLTMVIGRSVIMPEKPGASARD